MRKYNYFNTDLYQHVHFAPSLSNDRLSLCRLLVADIWRMYCSWISLSTPGLQYTLPSLADMSNRPGATTNQKNKAYLMQNTMHSKDLTAVCIYMYFEISELNTTQVRYKPRYTTFAHNSTLCDMSKAGKYGAVYTMCMCRVYVLFAYACSGMDWSCLTLLCLLCHCTYVKRFKLLIIHVSSFLEKAD